MGDCIYCGESAGFMRKSHRDCENQHKRGRGDIVSLITHAGVIGGDLGGLNAQLKDIASRSYINRSGIKDCIIEGYEAAVDMALGDHVISVAEEQSLGELQNHFGLSQQELDRNGAVERIFKGAVIRDVLDGEIPQRLSLSGPVPFNLQKSETLVWVFENVKYYEEKTRTEYRGGSRGVSIRVMKGVYYRVGDFKGKKVQTQETVHADTGLMGITTKHIYFAGDRKRFRIRFDRIVSWDAYSDGIGVMRDAQTAKPQSFVTGDGWFTYNLVSNLAQL